MLSFPVGKVLDRHVDEHLAAAERDGESADAQMIPKFKEFLRQLFSAQMQRSTFCDSCES
jgi:hypothetical protein